MPEPEVLFEAEPGTILEVLDEEEQWFWVIVPPDAHGTRRAGWIRANLVEPVERAASMTPDQGQRHEAGPQAGVLPSGAMSATATVDEDEVTITASRAEPASTRANPAASAKELEDVHFDRDRYSLGQEDMDILRAAVTTLKADPSLVVRIEGYTCSLGEAAYNLGLGMRRANAVKDYLVSEGIAAIRLHTISLGEQHAKHDNSREETRQLNRRVALVPGARP